MMCVTPVNISDEKLPPNFLNIIICCTCNIYPNAVEQTTEIYRPRRDKTCLLGFRQSESQTSLLSLTG